LGVSPGFPNPVQTKSAQILVRHVFIVFFFFLFRIIINLPWLFLGAGHSYSQLSCFQITIFATLILYIIIRIVAIEIFDPRIAFFFSIHLARVSIFFWSNKLQLNHGPPDLFCFTFFPRSL